MDSVVEVRLKRDIVDSMRSALTSAIEVMKTGYEIKALLPLIQVFDSIHEDTAKYNDSARSIKYRTSYAV